MAKAKKDECAQCSILTIVVCIVCLFVFTFKYFDVYKGFTGVRPATCTTVGSYISDEYSTRCTCGKNCYRAYDCLVIEVNLDKSGPPELELVTMAPPASLEEQVVHTLRAVQNRTMWLLSQSAEVTNRTVKLYNDEDAVHEEGCTFTMESCSSSKVAEFNETYGVPGTVFRCSYSDKHPGIAIRVTAGTSKFVHYFLWPSLGILIGVSYMIYACVTTPGVNFFTMIGAAHYLEGYVPCCKVSEVPDEEVKKDAATREQEEMEKIDLEQAQEASDKNEESQKFNTQYGMR